MSSAAPPRAPASRAIPAERLRARSQHAAVVFEDQQLSCVECHGSHGVKSVAAWKRDAAPNDYCLTCHSRPLTLQRPDGTSMELAVDALKLKASVHPDHGCADCHTGFSTSAHPAGAIGEPESSRHRGRPHLRPLPRRQAAPGRGERPLHAAALRGHRAPRAAPTATAPTRWPRRSGSRRSPARRAAPVTQKIFAAYAGSMHGKALASGDHFDAPLCSDCHRAHDVQGSAPARTGPRGLHRLPPDRRGDPLRLAAERDAPPWTPSPAPSATPRRRSGWLPCVSSR